MASFAVAALEAVVGAAVRATEVDCAVPLAEAFPADEPTDPEDVPLEAVACADDGDAVSAIEVLNADEDVVATPAAACVVALVLTVASFAVALDDEHPAFVARASDAVPATVEAVAAEGPVATAPEVPLADAIPVPVPTFVASEIEVGFDVAAALATPLIAEIDGWPVALLPVAADVATPEEAASAIEVPFEIAVADAAPELIEMATDGALLTAVTVALPALALILGTPVASFAVAVPVAVLTFVAIANDGALLALEATATPDVDATLELVFPAALEAEAAPVFTASVPSAPDPELVADAEPDEPLTANAAPLLAAVADAAPIDAAFDAEVLFAVAVAIALPALALILGTPTASLAVAIPVAAVTFTAIAGDGALLALTAVATPDVDATFELVFPAEVVADAAPVLTDSDPSAADPELVADAKPDEPLMTAAAPLLTAVAVAAPIVGATAVVASLAVVLAIALLACEPIEADALFPVAVAVAQPACAPTAMEALFPAAVAEAAPAEADVAAEPLELNSNWIHGGLVCGCGLVRSIKAPRGARVATAGARRESSRRTVRLAGWVFQGQSRRTSKA